jgi:hypothetical protein
MRREATSRWYEQGKDGDQRVECSLDIEGLLRLDARYNEFEDR